MKKAILGSEPFTDDRGFVLISVTMLAAVLASIAIGIIGANRRLSVDAEQALADIELRASTEAGLVRLIAAYSADGDGLREQLKPDGRIAKWQFAGRDLILRVQAESGKLDLNAGDRDHIQAVLNSITAPAVAAETLSKIQAARAANVRIETVASALGPLQRLSRTLDLMESAFTVFTGQRGIDPWTAPEHVLAALPGLSEDVRQKILTARASNLTLNAGQFPDGVRRYFVTQRPIYMFRAETESARGRKGAMQALIAFDERRNFKIFSWSPAGVYP